MIDWNKIKAYFKASGYKCPKCNSRATYPLTNAKGNQMYLFNGYYGVEYLVCFCKSCKQEFKFPLNKARRKDKKSKSIGGELVVHKIRNR